MSYTYKDNTDEVISALEMAKSCVFKLNMV